MVLGSCLFTFFAFTKTKILNHSLLLPLSDFVFIPKGVILSSSSARLISSDGKKSGSRRSFPLEYKLMIVEEAKRTNNSAAARVHNLNESVIRQWRKDETKIRESLDQGKDRHWRGK